MIKVLFSGRYFSDKLNETMEIVFLLQCNLYRKKYEKYNNNNYYMLLSVDFLDKHFFALLLYFNTLNTASFSYKSVIDITNAP
jgi:hypothetical protein